MALLKPLDPTFPIHQQLALPTAPVTLINIFTLASEDEPAFLAVWAEDAAFMKAQPGFISTQLHRAVGPSPCYLNHAVWESTAHFAAAFAHPEFQAAIAKYPASAVAAPHLFQKVAIPGICVA